MHSYNSRIPHIEDLIFEGKMSRVLHSVLDLFTLVQGWVLPDVKLTVKWDGSPSIIFGEMNNRFFVSTKSLFNKQPKLNYTNKDIDENHPQIGLNMTLKTALRYLPELGIKNIVQADVMFTQGLDQAVKPGFVYFQPNTIAYYVPSHSGLGEQIAKAKIGLVYHTTYSHDLKERSFDVSKLVLKETQNVWIRDASITVPYNLLNESDDQPFDDLYKHINDVLYNVPIGLQNHFVINKTINNLTTTFINSMIRESSLPDYGKFYIYVNKVLNESILNARKPETKNNRFLEKEEINKWLEINATDIGKMFALWNELHVFKVSLLDKFNIIDSGIKCFLEDSDGKLIPSKHEGYILSNDTKSYIVKLVDRYEFSKANFSNPKWS